MAGVCEASLSLSLNPVLQLCWGSEVTHCQTRPEFQKACRRELTACLHCSSTQTSSSLWLLDFPPLFTPMPQKRFLSDVTPALAAILEVSSFDLQERYFILLSKSAPQNLNLPPSLLRMFWNLTALSLKLDGQRSQSLIGLYWMSLESRFLAHTASCTFSDLMMNKMAA